MILISFLEHQKRSSIFLKSHKSSPTDFGKSKLLNINKDQSFEWIHHSIYSVTNLAVQRVNSFDVFVLRTWVSLVTDVADVLFLPSVSGVDWLVIFWASIRITKTISIFGCEFRNLIDWAWSDGGLIVFVRSLLVL